MIKNSRHNPRIKTSLHADVVNCTGEVMQARLVDLSIDGLSLHGDASFIDHIETKDQRTGEPDFPIEVGVRFRVETAEESTLVTLQARCVYKRRHSISEYQCGFKILEFEGDCKDSVMTFIQTAIDAQTIRSSGMPTIPVEQRK